MGLEINSFIANLILLIPVTYAALKIEKHYTKFWTAAWNAFSVGATAISMILAPANGIIIIDVFENSIPLYGLLLLYSVIIILIGTKYDSDILRDFASSRATASILLMNLIAQYQNIIDLGTIITVILISYAGLWILKEYMKTNPKLF